MKEKTLRICVCGLMATLAYISFTYLKINIPTPAGYTAFHLGNTFCVLASLLLGGSLGGIAGAIGMGIADVLDPVYILVAPKTIILKMMIGLVSGLMAHHVFHISKLTGKKLVFAVVVSASCGMMMNVIAEPIFSYFYTAYIMQAPVKAAEKLASWNAITTSTNAILAIILSSSLYLAISKRLKNNGTLKKLSPKTND